MKNVSIKKKEDINPRSNPDLSYPRKEQQANCGDKHKKI